MENQDSKTVSDKGKFSIEDFVSFSAQLMAAVRARESERPDRLFEDTFAAGLAGSKTLQLVAERAKNTNDGTLDRLAIRTRFFDDFLMSAVSEVRQVVILASGMDARAFRLPWPAGTHVYELDKPEVLAKKEAVLKQAPPLCHRHAIAADLTQTWIPLLLQHGYRSDLPSVWLLEGLLMYLTESEVRNLLRTICDMTAPGSYCGADILNVKALQNPDLAAKYWRSGFDCPEEVFASAGWDVEVVQPGEEGANFGRITEPLPPRDVVDIPRGFLVKAKK